MADKSRKEIGIDEEQLKWIYEHYGDDVSLSWFIGQLLTGFILVHDKSPKDYAKIAAGMGDVGK